MSQHKTILYLDTQDIADAALQAFGDPGWQHSAPASDEEAEEFISNLLRQRWKWTKESRKDYVARMAKLIDDACQKKEDLLRGYGGDCSYRFEKLWGPAKRKK